jgi:hypothetical protein
LLGEAHSLWQDDAETIEQGGLRRVWLGHAAQRTCPCAAVGRTTGKTTSWD